MSSTFFFPFTLLTQIYEDEAALSEALGFEEVSRFDTNSERLRMAIRANMEETLKKADALDLNNRIAPPEFEIKELKLEIEPPRKLVEWREPVEIKIHYLEWQREDGYCQAFVPVLNIAVISKEAAEFTQKIEAEIRGALTRSKTAKSLRELRMLERVREVKIEKAELAVTLKTPKQRAIDEEKEDEEKSVLEEIGEKLNDAKLSPAYEVGEYVEQLAEVLRAKQRTSVLLVGASGIGKTAILHELVRRRDAFGFKNTPFWTTSGARIVAGQTGFGMWQERCQKMVAEAKQQNAVLHLGNLIELLEVGKSTANTQGIASFFRPKIVRGELQIVVECTPEQLAVIEKRDANLLGAFQQIRLEEPDRETGLKILQDVAQERNADILSASPLEAIKTLDAVHRRYATYSAFPGRPVRFLRNLLQTKEADRMSALQSSNVLRAFSEETGLPLFLLSDEEKLNLAKTEKWFESRVLGQSEAVKLIVDLIATVKARLTRPRKPIASLLFIGATGVGKTELTKALAEFFFSDRERLVRFDMSEFSTPLAVARLIGGAGETEGQLTARMREQPFSVLLFDEFEKAHPQFFDLLLQILGEGRLTDSSGRVADFTNSIIVMTSNLGATTFGRGKSGFLTNAKEKRAAVQHFNAAVRDFLRPEIYNRLDRIVPFAPLDEETALKITALEIEKLKRREGLNFRQIKLDLEPEVLNFLAHKGYDVRYGARPLRRTIERELAAPLSAELNQRSVEEKLNIAVSLQRDSLQFAVETDASQKRRVRVGYVLAGLAHRAAELRRKSQKLQASYHLTELEDERYQLIKIRERNERGRWVSPEDLARLAKFAQIENFLPKTKNFNEDINNLEDRILLDIYGKAENADAGFPDELTINELRFDKLLRELLALKFEKPHEICVAIYSENAAALFRLVRAYLISTEHLGGEATEITAYTSVPQPDENSKVTVTLRNENDKILIVNPVFLFEREIWRQNIEKPEKFFASVSREVVGVLLRLRCELANPCFTAENGLHWFISGNQTNGVLVQTDNYNFAKHLPPPELSARNSLLNQYKRRIYDANNDKIQDVALGKNFEFDGKNIAPTVSEAIEINLQQTCENLIA